MSKQKYPEHEKQKKILDKSHIIGQFLEWLNDDQDVQIARYEEDGRWYPISVGIQPLLAKYFKIDLKKIEKEKQQMLAEIRSANEKGTNQHKHN